MKTSYNCVINMYSTIYECDYIVNSRMYTWEN
jgi:hypothetical protein